MRSLVEESIQQRVAVLLTEAGHDAVHLSDLDLLGATDDQVLASASEAGRTLITADTDFGALHSLTGFWGPSVLLAPSARCSSQTGQIGSGNGSSGALDSV